VGTQLLELGVLHHESFHSINVPSEWGLADSLNKSGKIAANGFHSINVPSEWGLLVLFLRLGLVFPFPFN
jgi:hypothetical protein